MAGLYEAPAMERRVFTSWDDFFSFMEQYQQRTGQTFNRRTATSVKTRNQVLASISVSGRFLPPPLLPESFLDYSRMLQCAHRRRGEADNTTRWNGVQSSECQARVNATLQLCEDRKYRIRVTKVNLVHNHPLGGTVQDVTASPSATEAENELHVAKRRRVGHLKYPGPDEAPESGRNSAVGPSTEISLHVPTMADVQNFLERVECLRVQQPGHLQSVEERLTSYVNEFAAQDGNAAKIFVDDEKVLSSITLQTKHMRKVFEVFPEVLRVDAIPPAKEGSADSSYQVFSLMAHDTLGNWQYVQHAIVESDRSETLRAALDQFKAHNARHPRIRALILPHGDSLQLEELRASFPAARVLYSQFHVVRALHQAISEHGEDLTSWHRDRLTGIAQVLVYAPTSLVYGANIAAMAEVLGSKQHPFFHYFLESWDSCRDRWATFAREGVTSFSVSETDDQFAPTWKAIFAAVNDDMALDQTVAAIRYYQAVVERAFIRELNREAHNGESSHRSSNLKDEYDAEMRLLAATVSPAASSLVFPQYRYAISRGAYQFCEPSRGSFFVSAVSHNDVFCDDPSKEFCVEADRGWQCSCAFMVNHHLPCRHVFYIRRIVRCSCVIPMEHIEPRWVLAKAKHFFDPPQNAGSIRDAANEAELEHGSDYERQNVIAPPGSWQKYVTAQEVGKRISQRMMEMKLEEFTRALDFYKLVETTLNVRPFNLNSAAVARLHSQARARKPNWVEPDPSRTLAPRAGLPVTVYTSVGDHIAAAVAARNIQQAQLGTRPHTAPARPQTNDVIDLQDESEEEEKTDDVQQNEPARSGDVAVSDNDRDNDSEKESSPGKENGDVAVPDNNRDNDSEKDSSAGKENRDVAVPGNNRDNDSENDSSAGKENSSTAVQANVNESAQEDEHQVDDKISENSNDEDAVMQQDDEAAAEDRGPLEGIDGLGNYPENTAPTSPSHSPSFSS